MHLGCVGAVVRRLPFQRGARDNPPGVRMVDKDGGDSINMAEFTMRPPEVEFYKRDSTGIRDSSSGISVSCPRAVRLPEERFSFARTNHVR